MTIRTLNGGFFFPQPWGGQASGRFVSNTTSVAVLNDRVAFVFDAPATGTITGCTIWVATNTAGIDCRLETVNGAGATAGTPTGTLAGTNTNVAIASGSTGAQTVTFTGSYSATIGDRLSITINQTGVGTVALATPTLAAQPPGAGGGSLVWKETAGTWAVQARVMAMALNYGGTYYYIPGCFAVDSAATYTGNIGSGAERGIQFKLPYKTQVMGWFTLYAPSGVQADFDMTLYDNAGGPYNVILQRNVILGGYTWAAGAVYGDLLTGSFNGVATLSASTVYNLAMKQRNANNITYHETRLIDVATTAIAGMWNGGTDMKGILRASTGATAFTVSSTQFPYVMGIICSGFDDGAGGGGGGLLVHPGMGGGARG